MSNHDETVAIQAQVVPELRAHDARNGGVLAPRTPDSLADRSEFDIDEFRARVKFEAERIKLMQAFVSEQMQENSDYGTIPGTPKPSLYKAGAEKLANIYALKPAYQETERVLERSATKHYEVERWIDGVKKKVAGDARGYVKYSIRCTLTKNGRLEGEGVGTCNSWERKYVTQDLDDVENTILKMAKKRAFIDAILTATRASNIFTQDIEDHPPAAEENRKAKVVAKSTDGAVVEFGKNKGTPLSKLNDKQLDGYIEMFDASIADPAKARFKERNEEQRAVFAAEKMRRGGSPIAETGARVEEVLRLREELRKVDDDNAGLFTNEEIAAMNVQELRKAIVAARPAAESDLPF